MLEMIGAGAPAPSDLKRTDAINERPFVPELAWAYFKAYSSILTGNYMIFKLLESGIDNPIQFINREHTKEILKAALPHQSQWIDTVAPEAYHNLLDELELYLLAELRKILDGVELSAEELEKAQRLLSIIGRADADQAKAAMSLVRQ